jgi:glucose/mannose-6-phosphate isomerase
VSGTTAARIGHDPADMTGRVLGFPEQVREAWRRAAAGPDLLAGRRPSCVWIVGMGGSAIGGDFVRALAESRGRVPVEVVRGYEMPHGAGAGGFAFFVSYSGDTEETLSAWDDAARRGVPCAAVAGGGELRRRAEASGVPCQELPGGWPPRAALAWTTLPVLHALARADLVPLDGAAVEEAAGACAEQLASFGPDGPLAPRLAEWAERAAGGLPVIYAADRPHRATAARWVGQLNENGKTLAHAAVFPEQNHNEIVAWERPAGGARLAEVALLEDPAVHPRVRRRLALVAARVEEAGRRVARFAPRGEGLLARLLSLSVLGDLASLHVAAARGVDPTPVAGIDRLKRDLA